MKYWAFDLDGTLVDSFEHYFVALKDIFQEYGASFSPDLRLPALTQYLPNFFEFHLGPLKGSLAMEKLRNRSNADAAKVQPFPGIIPLLQTLMVRGSRFAVWTNRDWTSTQLILKHTGLDQMADLCISGTCVTRRKPHPEGLIKIAEHFQCKPSEIIMVGDHEYDVTAAKSVGAKGLRASWHSYWPAEECLHSNHQFHAVSDFTHWVTKLCG